MGEKKRVLIAEDDRAMQRLLSRIVADEGHEVVTADDGLAAIARLEQPFDLVLTDMRMPGADGAQVLELVQRRWPSTPVVVLTAFGSIPGAVDAMRFGAFDYITKPLPDPQTLRSVVARALQSQLPRGVDADLVVVDPAMTQVVEAARRVAIRDTTVLLLGESGTGKEVLARLVHEHSTRAKGPFVAVNCAALTESLLESELFGHERGAFTGAVARHEGRFEQAHEGTLFLDEIGEMSAALQAKLLRVLQDKTFERVGGEHAISVDVRLVAATNRELQTEVRAGSFREDLYYRLAVFPIEIPPLRRRPADIIPMAEHFLRLLTRGPSRTAPTLTEDARAALAAYDWPGNVRELQNVMERCLVLSGGAPITSAILGLPTPTTAPASGGEPPAEVTTLKEMEKRAIQAALVAEGGNRRRAAKRLGIALRTLQYKIKEYEIDS
jgi:two-component system, NtrC family, response regulator AtoC